MLSTTNGQFIKIEEPEDIDLETESASIRYTLLSQNRPFTVFYRGKSIGELKNGIIEESTYDCTSIIVSTYTNGQLHFPEKRLVPAQARAGYAHSERVSYVIQYYLAVTSDSPIVNVQPYQQLLQREASQNDFVALKEWVVQALKQQNAAIKAEKVSLSTISTFLPPGYQRPLYIFTAHTDTEDNCESKAVVAQVAKGQVIPLLNEPQSNPIDS